MKSLSCHLTESPLMKMEMSHTPGSWPGLIPGMQHMHFIPHLGVELFLI